MKRKWLFGLMLVCLLGLLAIPLVQTMRPIFSEPKLMGAVIVGPKPGFSLAAIRTGDFQDSLTTYCNDVFGLRPLFIKTNNEIQFKLFDILKAKSVVSGKDGYLFEQGYIDAYLGKDFLGSKTIEQKAAKLKEISDSLEAIGIAFVIVLAPNKARFYADRLPGRYMDQNYTETQVEKTNYGAYVRWIKKYGISCFDVGAWFEQIKDTVPYPLITKYGIHWSSYGMILVMDSLMRKIEDITSYDLPSIEIDTVVPDHSYETLDYDLAAGLNTLFPLHQPLSGMPQYQIDTTTHQMKKSLVIADSYYSVIYTDSLAASLFDQPHFWYYFRELYQWGKGMKKNSQVNLSQELYDQDVIILMATEFNLFNFGWGFIDQTHAMLHGKSFKLALDPKRIQEFIRLIKANPGWLEQVKLKAEQRGLPLDSMIVRDAKYMVEREAILQQKK